MSEIDRLAKWIMSNCPEEVGLRQLVDGKCAVDVAIRMMRECMSWRVTAKAGKET